MIVHVNSVEEFNEKTSSGLWLVDYYADWCPPCRVMGQFLERYAEYLNILKVDVEKLTDLARKFNISSIPVLQIWDRGKLVREYVGFSIPIVSVSLIIYSTIAKIRSKYGNVEIDYEKLVNDVETAPRDFLNKCGEKCPCNNCKYIREK